MYRCARCKERTQGDIRTVGFQCEKCNFKVFYKERPNVRKVVHAK